MSDEHFQVVFHAQDEFLSFLYRSMLQEAGIDVFERELLVPTMPHLLPHAAPRFHLLVKQEDAERARALIAQFAASADAGDLDVTDADTAPPHPTLG